MKGRQPDKHEMIEYAYGTLGRYEAGEDSPWQRVTDKSTGRVAFYRRVKP